MEFNPATPTRRAVPLALKLASLPPLAMGSPIDEKDQLPCIMITPSSPVHDHDYQIHFFQAEKQRQGFMSYVREAFWINTPAPIALSDSLPPHYGTARPTCWSSSKRFRMVLMLAACLFFALHLAILPRADSGGLFDLVTAHGSPYDHTEEAVTVSWEKWIPEGGEPTAATAAADVVTEAADSATSTAMSMEDTVSA